MAPFLIMNDRLEIASRAIPGFLADTGIKIATDLNLLKTLSKSALAVADALIKLEEETRPKCTDHELAFIGGQLRCVKCGVST